MDSGSLVSIVENLVFWCVIVYIAWNEHATPSWIYLVLLALIVYYAVRTIFRKQGTDRMVWLYTLNMGLLVYLLVFFGRK